MPARTIGLDPGVWIARNKDHNVIGGEFNRIKDLGMVDVVKVCATLEELAVMAGIPPLLKAPDYRDGREVRSAGRASGVGRLGVYGGKPALA